MKNRQPDIRFLNDMRKVLYDRKWAKDALNLELYYMYRGIKEKDGLRYDITIIPPKMLGREFVKTTGHGHIGPYPEIYTVLKGKAFFLMQKRTGGKIKDVCVVKAKKGGVCLIRGGYEHITINPSKKEILKMANWISKKCQSDYIPIKRAGGACYFYAENGWVKNKNYKNIPKLRFEKPLKKMPKDLKFLNP